MTKALANVKTVEITFAARSTRIGNLRIARKQPIGFLNSDLVAVGDDNLDVVNRVMSRIDLNQMQVVTIYYGADTDVTEAEGVAENLRQKYSHLQIEVIKGGQPHYGYIISVE